MTRHIRNSGFPLRTDISRDPGQVPDRELAAGCVLRPESQLPACGKPCGDVPCHQRNKKREKAPAERGLAVPPRAADTPPPASDGAQPTIRLLQRCSLAAAKASALDPTKGPLSHHLN